VRLRREGDEEVLLANFVVTRIQALSAVVVNELQRPKTEGVPTEIGAASGNPNSALLPPDQQGDLNALAATLAGMALLFNSDGSISGFSALGLDAGQNNVTLNGMQVGSNTLPRDAAVTTRVNTTSFDASKGHFSGAQVAMTSMSGGPVQQHTLRVTLDDPALQYSDRAARSLGQQQRNFQLSGSSSGEMVKDKSNYNVSWQFGRRVSPLNTLLDADSSGLARLGLTADSVARYQSILHTLGVPFSVAGIPTDRRNDNASAFGRIDWNRPDGGALSSTFSLNYSNNSAVALSARSLPSYGGDSRNWNANVQGNINKNLGSRFLTELSVQASLSDNTGDPFLPLPSGSVLVSTLAPDGGSSIGSLQFGSGSSLYNSNRSGSFGADNTLSWFNGSSRHRVKFNQEINYEWYDQLQSGNALGTFTYNSLADLEAGKAASFVRRIGAQRRTGDALGTGASVTDTWRKTDKLQFQLGARVDAMHYPSRPQYNPEIAQLFGLRTDHVPSFYAISPRLGFSLNVGKAPASVGTMFGPSVFGTLRGGLGRFVNTNGSGSVAGAIDATGLPSGAQQLTCVGSAVPQVDWKQYLQNQGNIPTECADGTGASAFTVGSPRVVTFDPSYRTQSSWRANLGWNGYLGARFRINLDGVYSLNTHQNASLDRNFDATTRFVLAAEDGRPVFVTPSAIVPTSGAISLRSSRRSSKYAQVMSNLGDGEARSISITIGLSPVQRTFSVNPTSWNISWTTVSVRDKVRGFGGNTAGNPLEFAWGRASGDIAHQINASIRKGFGTTWNVNISGRIQSGQPFTPNVGGDINGDGLSNDRAFVFNPAVAGDSAVVAGMSTLLASAPAGVRACLQRQLGHLAERNSCRGPWSGSLNVQIAWNPRNTPWGDRVRFGLSLANPLAGLDALWHRGNMEGWGQPGFADPTLLYVRGFDAARNRFVYEVNQRFGETRGTRSLPAQPFRATFETRISLGPSMERQQAQIELRGYRRPGAPTPTVASIKQRNTASAAATLRPLLAQKDSVGLTKMQVDSVNALVARLTKVADSLWTPTAEYILKLGANDADADLVRRLKETRAAVLQAQFTAYRAVRGLLTVEQKKKLRPPISFMIEEDYMKSVLLNNASSSKMGS